MLTRKVEMGSCAATEQTNLNSLGIHFVKLVRVCPVESSISLLIDKKIREVCFFELKVDGFDEGLGNKLGSFAAELHDFGHVLHPKLDHDRICVTVNDLCVEVVPIGNGELFLHKLKNEGDKHSATRSKARKPKTHLLCLRNHVTTIGSDARRDLQTWQLAVESSGKSVHRIGADLLTWSLSIQYLLTHRVGKGLTFKANCRPSSTARLKGSVSFLRSALARFLAARRSLKMVGSKPFLLCAFTKRSRKRDHEMMIVVRNSKLKQHAQIRIR